jgi:hypothetical protein
MKVSNQIQKLIDGKLRRPVHINYISRYIFNLSVDETREILQNYIKEGLIVESKYASDYYVLKPQ